MVPEGAQCISLGPQTPLEDIRRAAIAHKAHIVALSFSAAFPVRQATDGLATLRRQLPAHVTLWAGGEMTRRVRKTHARRRVDPRPRRHTSTRCAAGARTGSRSPRDGRIAPTRIIGGMWTAVVLGTLIVGGVAAYVALPRTRSHAGAPVWPFIVGLPFAYLAVPFVFTCIWITLGWWLRAERPDDVALTWRQRLRLFANEFASLAQSAPKMILYRVLMRDPPPAPATLPVLLLHGVGCNAGVWTGFRRYLERARLGPVYALSYGPPLASIEHFADQLAAKIDADPCAPPARTQVVLVAHSMGGLVARAYLRRFGGAHVRRLITIGTPHSGSMHAWLMTGVSLAEMRPGSAFLAGLNSRRRARARACPWCRYGHGTTRWSRRRPRRASTGPTTSSIAGVAHNALLSDRDVWQRVADEIARRALDEQSVDAPRASTVH